MAERRPVAAAGRAQPARRPGLRPSLPVPSTDRLPAGLQSRTSGIVGWARDVRTELRKVAWPTREEATKLTTVVIAITVAVGVFLGTVDALFSHLLQWFLS